MKSNIINLNKYIATLILLSLGVMFPFYIVVIFLIVGLLLNWFTGFSVILISLVRVLLFSSGERNHIFEGLIILCISILILIIKKYTRKNSTSYDFI